MGLVNTVVPYADLEKETVRWCREMLRNSPIALRCLKAALNADCDGQSGLQELAGNATMLFYMTEEGQEGRNALTKNAHQTSVNSDVILNLNIKVRLKIRVLLTALLSSRRIKWKPNHLIFIVILFQSTAN